jgi:hypothetical protein
MLAPMMCDERRARNHLRQTVEMNLTNRKEFESLIRIINRAPIADIDATLDAMKMLSAKHV